MTSQNAPDCSIWTFDYKGICLSSITLELHTERMISFITLWIVHSVKCQIQVYIAPYAHGSLCVELYHMIYTNIYDCINLQHRANGEPND